MELLGDVGHVESHFFFVWTHSMVPIGDEAQVEACFGLSNIVLILVQDRCTVCDERTVGSENNLDAPNGTPR